MHSTRFFFFFGYLWVLLVWLFLSGFNQKNMMAFSKLDFLWQPCMWHRMCHIYHLTPCNSCNLVQPLWNHVLRCTCNACAWLCAIFNRLPLPFLIKIRLKKGGVFKISYFYYEEKLYLGLLISYLKVTCNLFQSAKICNSGAKKLGNPEIIFFIQSMQH